LAFVVTACAPTATPGPAASGAGPSGPSGSITVVVNSEPPTLASWTSRSSYGYPILRNITEALLNRDPKTMELVPELAVSWSQVDPRTWRFKLREGVRFHDGSPLTAEVAAFSLNYTWGKAQAFGIRGKLASDLEAKAVDLLTLDVTTESPDPILASRLYISPLFSKKAFDAEGGKASYELHPVGTGPYSFVEWVKGQYIALKANPDWWGNKASDARGKITFAEAKFTWRLETSVRATMVKTGEANLARWISPEDCKAAAQCVQGLGQENMFLRVDPTHPALKDVRVREAIAISFDRESIVKGIVGGGVTSGQMVGPDSVGYNADLKPYPYNLERAKKLVADAKAAGTVVDAPVTLYSRRDLVPRVAEITEYLSAQLKLIGLNAKVNLMETQAYQTLFAIKPAPPERGMIAIHSATADLFELQPFVSGYFRCAGPSSVVCDSTMEAMETKAQVTLADARKKAYAELAAYTYTQYWAIPIGISDVRFALSPNLAWTNRKDDFILLKEITRK
jgi:peptide/nickel transport system substrate-binding protein